MKIWSYECNQEGVKLEKRKNEIQVCKWDKSIDNFLVKTYQSFDEKGKTVRFVSRYTLKDTLLVETTTYDENDIISYHSTYNKSYDKPLTISTYSKGKIRYEFTYKYENNLLVSDSYTRNGKLRYKTDYTYNAEGMLKGQIQYDKKGNLVCDMKMDYEE